MARQTKVRITIPSVIARVHNYQPFNRLTNTATTSYVYNANGNMVSKTVGANTTQFYWDYENRLKQVILPSGQNVVYKYDALGRRSERNVNNSTSWTKFTYDGQDVILDQNSDGTSVTYLNGAGIDNKIRQTVNGQAQYFLSDHLGSTNALTDATGTVISSTNYDSFGNATNSSFPTRYQFTGREFDDLTGLHYYRARFYDANLGRFISEDPIGLNGGINPFVYVKNNPLFYKDPLGLTENPFYYGCVATYTTLGSGVGFVAGGGLGLLTGPAAVVASPLGIAAGTAIGGAIGGGIGSLACGTPPFPDQSDTWSKATRPVPFPNAPDKTTCDAKPKSVPRAESTPNQFPDRRFVCRKIGMTEFGYCKYICSNSSGMSFPYAVPPEKFGGKCPQVVTFP
jgi:RHS repeat-associated protein